MHDLLIVILSPIIYILTLIILFVTNNIYFVFLWFYKMSWFFKKNANCKNKKAKAKWVDIEMLYDMTGYMYAMFLTGFALMFSIGVIISLFINPFFSLPSMTMIYTLISSMICKGEIKEKPINVFSIIWYVFKNYKSCMFIFLCFLTIFRSSISEKLFNLYTEYNEKKTGMLINFGENLSRFSKDMSKLNDGINKIDVLNVVDRVDVVGARDLGKDNDRKLNNQLEALYKKNRKLTNTQNEIADVMEDAYNVNTPFSILVLCVMFALLSSFGMFTINDYSMFSPTVDYETNDVECDGTLDEEEGGHTSIYKTYMMGKSIFNSYKNLVKERATPVVPLDKESIATVKEQVLKDAPKPKSNIPQSVVIDGAQVESTDTATSNTTPNPDNSPTNNNNTTSAPSSDPVSKKTSTPLKSTSNPTSKPTSTSTSKPKSKI